MSKQLKLAGYTVSVANHGVEALAHIRKSRFCKPNSGASLDLVLMDVEMPVMDGLTCVRELRAMESCGDIVAHLPVIAVTANARAEQLAAAIEAGMDGVVTKPFRMQELLPELERLGSTA
jgi:CheY-like chemotaxis protein